MIRRVYHGIKDVLVETIRSFIKDDPMRHAAEIGFYTIFSLPAVLIIMVWIAGIVFGEGQVRAELIFQVSKVLGADIALQFQNIIVNTIISHSSPRAFAVGVVTLIISATTVFMSLQNALNNIWCVKPKPKRGWLKHIINQAISFAFVIGLGFLLLVSLILDIVIALVTDHINAAFSRYTATLILVVNNLFSLTVIMFVFAIIFKVLPDVKIKWKDVWVGSF